MANVKCAALDGKAVANLLLTGTVGGGVAYGLIHSLRRIQEDRRMRKNLAKLEDIAQRELSKDDISISGDFFRDKYIPYTKQAGAEESQGLQNLPGLALLLSGAGIGYAGTGILSELLKKKTPPQTPQFAIDYKNKRQKEFERAVRLLRAVTDAPTWKGLGEKSAELKKKATQSLVEIRSPKVDAEAANLVRTTTKGVVDPAGRVISNFEKNLNNYVYPAIGATAIGGAGYLTYKALTKLLYAIRNAKKKDLAEDAAVNAWLAQRQELGEPGKVLNAYIENNDSAERKELNKILKAYESRYKK